MAQFHQNESTKRKRNLRVFLYLDDNVTPVPLGTLFLGTKAKRKLGGLTATFAGYYIEYFSVGIVGNGFTLTLVADGAGIGSLTNAGNDYTFHYASGVTTLTNFIAILGASGIFSVGGGVGGATTLAAGDAAGPLKLAGGTDKALFVESSDDNAVCVVNPATGLFVNQGYDGCWVYQYTQAELNITCTEIALRIDRIPTPAYLDLGAHTTHCDTIVEDKTAIGDAGNATTLESANTGAGAGTLDESAYPVILWKYATGVTTNKNFEDAVVASANLRIKQYATNWTALFVSPADTFAPTSFAGGLIFKRPWELTSAMIYGDFDSQDENGKTYGDTHRKQTAAVANNLTGPYAGGALAFKSDDGVKTRFTAACDGTQRLVTDVDLTP